MTEKETGVPTVRNEGFVAHLPTGVRGYPGVVHWVYFLSAVTVVSGIFGMF